MKENQKIQQHILDKYDIMKKLGSGAYGHVWKIKSKQSGNIYALKKIFEAFQHATDAQRTYRQISILKKLKHHNIIKIYDIIESQNKNDIYLIFQCMETDLCNAIYENILEKIHEKYIIYQATLALYYLHSAQLIHRDLKPSNILLKGDCTAKICDFGLVRFIGAQTQTNILTQGVATRWYRAPQILLGSNSYNDKADMWSLGCIIAQIILKNPIFPGGSTIQQLQKIIQFTGKPPLKDISSINCQLAEHMINKIQIRNKSKKQYFSSTVLNSNQSQCIDLIYKLLEFNPNKRYSALEVLKHPYLKQFFNETHLQKYEGLIQLEIDDNIQLNTDEYRNQISLFTKKQTINQSNDKNQPQKFSDLKKAASESKLNQKNKSQNKQYKRSSHENSKQKKTRLFQELLTNSSHNTLGDKKLQKKIERPQSNVSNTSSILKQQKRQERSIKKNSNSSQKNIRFTDKQNVSENIKDVINNKNKILEKFETKTNKPLINLTAKSQLTSFSGLKKVTKYNR